MTPVWRGVSRTRTVKPPPCRGATDRTLTCGNCLRILRVIRMASCASCSSCTGWTGTLTTTPLCTRDTGGDVVRAAAAVAGAALAAATGAATSAIRTGTAAWREVAGAARCLPVADDEPDSVVHPTAPIASVPAAAVAVAAHLRLRN